MVILILGIVALVLLAPLVFMAITGVWGGVILYLLIATFVVAVISYLRARFAASSYWLIATSFFLMWYAALEWHTVYVPWEWYAWIVAAAVGIFGINILWYTTRVLAGAGVLVFTLFLVTDWDLREVSLGWWGALVAALVVAAVILALFRLFILAVVALAIALLVWLLASDATWQWWVVAGLVLAAAILLAFVAGSAAKVLAVLAIAAAVVLGLLTTIGLMDWGNNASPENFAHGPAPSASATTSTPSPSVTLPTPTESPTVDECPAMYVQRPIERTGNSYIRGGINGLLGENGTKAPASEKLDAYLRAAGENGLLLSAYSAPTIPSEWPDPNNEGPLLNDDRDCLSERGQELHTTLTNVWEAAAVMNVDMPDNGYLSGIITEDGDELVVVAFRTGIPQGRRGIQITLADESRTIYIDDATGAVVYLSQPGNVPVDSALDPRRKPPAAKPSPSPSPTKTKPKSSSSTGGDKGEGGSSGTGGSTGGGSGGTTGGSGGSSTVTPAPNSPKPTNPPSPTSTPAVTRTTTVPAPVTETTTIPAP